MYTIGYVARDGKHVFAGRGTGAGRFSVRDALFSLRHCALGDSPEDFSDVSDFGWQFMCEKPLRRPEEMAISHKRALVKQYFRALTIGRLASYDWKGVPPPFWSPHVPYLDLLSAR